MPSTNPPARTDHQVSGEASESPGSGAAGAIRVAKESGAAPAPASTSRPRMPGLDVMRGVAIVLVMLRHGWPSTFTNGGIVGVVLFFALSGYLITGVLDSEMARRGRIAYWRFYRNRLIRLYPAMLAMFAIYIAVELTVRLIDEPPRMWRSVLGGVTYTTDLWFKGLSPGLTHLWTLAIEEQFYLVWPVVFVFALRRRAVAACLTIGIVGLTVLSWFVIHHVVAQVAVAYVLPSSWAVTLLIGAAGYLNRDRLLPLLRGWRGWIAAVIAVAVVVLLVFLPDGKGDPLTYLVGGPVVAVCSVVFILQAEKWRQMPRVLEPLRVLGLVSYAAYLWNYLIVTWVRAAFDGQYTFKMRVFAIALTILAATLSWWLVEKPFARYRRRLDVRDRAARHSDPARP